jgi:glyoxylase-like metal-dependent hydrolase (beta-lactamase superfamily II)/GNAT superfamily N-acetyltransferase
MPEPMRPATAAATASLVLVADGPPVDGLPHAAGIEVRTARPDDAEELARLYFAAYPAGVAAASAQEARADIDASFAGDYGPLLADASLVAIQDGRLVGGVLTVERAPWDDVPSCAFVIELFVEAAVRRRGIGGHLLGHAMAAVGGPIALRVAADNAEARGLYGRLGFRETNRPVGRDARVDVLLAGSVNPTVISTCTLVRDGGLVAVVDPGMAPDREAILAPLRALGVAPEDVTAVVLSHHHPDHTMNAALFPNAAIHDHWAVYRGDDWESRECEGTTLSPSVRLIRTPGHSAEDLSVLVGTPDGVMATTHLWWTADGPQDDPYAPDLDSLARSRRRIKALADLVIPGHGAPFRPSAATPF